MEANVVPTNRNGRLQSWKNPRKQLSFCPKINLENHSDVVQFFFGYLKEVLTKVAGYFQEFGILSMYQDIQLNSNTVRPMRNIELAKIIHSRKMFSSNLANLAVWFTDGLG